MPRIKDSSPLSKKPTSIKLTPEIEELIAQAADRMDRPKQEVIRLALEVGMERMRRINYDIAGAIEDAASEAESLLRELPITAGSAVVVSAKKKRG